MTIQCNDEKNCKCDHLNFKHKRIVITGGPGAGKTAVLEIARKYFCEHIAILPEAATILFSGGFWRHKNVEAKKASQRAIFYIQREMERLVEGEQKTAVALCDRGTLDGLAYWPESEEEFFKEIGTTKAKEYARYDAVIHLRCPSILMGYNHSNPVRIETAEEALILDEKILKVWEGHPNRFIIDSSGDFLTKVSKTISAIRNHLPECCKTHKISELGEN